MQDDNRRDRLNVLTSARTPPPSNPHYSRIVAILRLALPLLAIAIIAVVLAWPRMDRLPEMVAENKKNPGQPIANELVNPRFESEDKEGQPYVITAQRAQQSSKDKDVVILDNPNGQAVLKDGDIIGMKSLRGAYRQKAQRLLLDRAVTLEHNKGYHAETERLMIDMAQRTAWTDMPVRGEGPAGKLKAMGLKASADAGSLIFTGPATLILYQSSKGF